MQELKKIILGETFVTCAIGMAAFLVYTSTICPTISFTDCGELATVAVTLGIAHPTGYPLFTLLERVAVMLYWGRDAIVGLNLFGALLTACAVSLFFKTSMVLLDARRTFSSQPRQKEASRRKRIMSAALGSLVVAFSSTFWSQSAAIEVYALQLVLFLLSVWTFVKGVEEQISEEGSLSRYLVLFGFILGLSFANHMTTNLLAPAFLFLYFKTFGSSRASFGRIVMLALPFLLGLSIYLYLPIRAAIHPPLDWGHPVPFERFAWHFTGKQYRVWMFEGWDVVQKQARYYVSNFSHEFHWTCTILGALGVLTTFRSSKRLCLFLILLFLSSVLYAVNYDIHDIDSYFLLSFLATGWFVVVGLEFVFDFTKARSMGVSILVYAVLVGLIPLQLLRNRGEVDQSRNRMPEYFTCTAIKDLDSSAVVISGLWDYFISPSYYVQMIRGEYPGFTVIDRSLLQNRSWYFLQLERNHPWLYNRCRETIGAFLSELDKFEHDRPFSFPVIQLRWTQLLDDIVRKSLPDHSVYVDGRVEGEFSSEFERIPAGLFVRLKYPSDSVQVVPIRLETSDWVNNTPAATDMCQYCALMLVRHAIWTKNHGFPEDARALLRQATQLDPLNPSIPSIQAALSASPTP